MSIIPKIATKPFNCGGGSHTPKGGTIYLVNGDAECGRCAYPAPEPRRLRLIRRTVKAIS